MRAPCTREAIEFARVHLSKFLPLVDGRTVVRQTDRYLHTWTSEMHASGPEVSLTFFEVVRKTVGITKKLQSHNDLLTLVQGPCPKGSREQVLRYDRLPLLGRGIGITATIHFVATTGTLSSAGLSRTLHAVFSMS